MSEKDATSLERIDRLAQALKNTKLGAPLIEFGILQDIQINWVEGADYGGRYYYSLMDGHAIDLNPECDDYTLLAVLAHELRHCEQFMMLDICSLTEFSFDDAVVLQRYLEADACAYSSAVCCEMFRNSGDKKYIELNDLYNDNDILQAMIDTMAIGAKLEKDKSPYQSAFNQWFQDDGRIDLYDGIMVQAFKHEEDSFLKFVMPQQKKKMTYKTLGVLGSIGPRFNYLKGRGGLDLKKGKYTKAPKFRYG